MPIWDRVEGPVPAGPVRNPVHRPRAIFFGAVLLLVVPTAALGAAVTHSAAGDVTASTAVVWGRCDGPSSLRVGYVADGEPEREASTPVSAERDFTGRVLLQNLRPETTYRYAVRCDAGAERTGTVRTAPPADAPRAMRFAWSGDLGGQNACRDAKTGYAIFDHLSERNPAFFLALGDMIYADDPCRRHGRYGNEQIPGPDRPATTRSEFWAVWRYNRSDPTFQRFLDRTPMLAIWDDHEILNDAGPQRDTVASQRGTHLLPAARQAFLDYQPLVPPADDPTRLYRSIRWGRHVEVFVLDTRQYRDANDARDDARRPKTLLGTAQRDWLVAQLAASNATWKIVVSSVPISIPTCGPKRGCDGWANLDHDTGFEHELRAVLAALRAERVRNMVWLTTDVHFATGFRYTPFPDERDFQLTEFVAGPLNAGVFPQRAFDRTFGPKRLFFYGPPDPAAITSFDRLRPWLNFGIIDVTDAGDLRLQIVNGNGAVVAAHELRARRN